jgi:hypothetical protein
MMTGTNMKQCLKWATIAFIGVIALTLLKVILSAFIDVMIYALSLTTSILILVMVILATYKILNKLAKGYSHVVGNRKTLRKR